MESRAVRALPLALMLAVTALPPGCGGALDKKAVPAEARAPVPQTRTASSAREADRPWTNAVDEALEWLDRHQAEDGRWDPGAFDSRCKGRKCTGHGDPQDAPGTTGLALMAYFGNLESQKTRKSVRNGLRYLQSIQGPDGGFGPRTDARHGFNHVLATLAMLDAHGWTSSRLFQPSAQAGLDHLFSLRNEEAAWGMNGPVGASDLRVTAWAVAALAAGAGSGLEVPADALLRAKSWLDRSGGDSSPLAAAVRTQALVTCGATQSDPLLLQDRKTLEANPLTGLVGKGAVDLSYAYFGYRSAFAWGGDLWRRWWRDSDELLLPFQETGGDACARGSWDPGKVSAPLGGRIGATAMSVTQFEACFRSTYRNSPGMVDKPLISK